MLMLVAALIALVACYALARTARKRRRATDRARMLAHLYRSCRMEPEPERATERVDVMRGRKPAA